MFFFSLCAKAEICRIFRWKKNYSEIIWPVVCIHWNCVKLENECFLSGSVEYCRKKREEKKILAHKLLFPLCKNRGHFHHQLFKSGSDNNLSSAFFLLLYSCERKQNRGKYFLRDKGFIAPKVLMTVLQNLDLRKISTCKFTHTVLNSIF